MLTGVHFILTYQCIFQCDHCFVHSGPEADDRAFTVDQVQAVLDEAARLGTVEWIYFEGGEPYMLYPVLIEGIRRARAMGFKVGVVTNTYYATNAANAELFLKPLVDLGIDDLSISDDAFHGDITAENPARIARAAAERLGLPVGTICIEAPTVEVSLDKGSGKGEPIVGGDVMFRGRAADQLVEGLPRQDYRTFTSCPYEELEHPRRVHVDPHGHVHICQGISMGNLWETPLADLVRDYQAEAHPICGPLLKGGPALLAEEHGVPHEEGYVDACHFCYLTRKQLLDRFPKALAPGQVYGLKA